MSVEYLTFQDAIDHTYRYLGGGPSEVTLADIKSAVDLAYRDVYNARTWSYYYKHGRINTVAPFSSGTVSYASSTRLVQLTTTDGSVFPSWAANGYIRVGTAIHRVRSRVSDTVLALDAVLSPVSDLPAGTPFILYQDGYLLPEDFLAGDQATYENSFGGLTYTHPREWLFAERYIYQAGMPQAFTITGSEQYPGRLLLRLFPVPTDSKTLDFIYKRAPRSVIWSSVATGTMSVSGTTATSSASVFLSSMAGSVIRTSYNTKQPTNRVGLNPAAFEALVVSVESASSATLDTAPTADISAAAYVISDPIDVEPQAMRTCVLRGCEAMIGMSRTLKDKPNAREQYLSALREAMERDSRSFSRRFAGDTWVHRQRAKDMPLDLYPTYK